MATAASNTIVKKVRNLVSLDEACRVSVTHWFLAGSHVLMRKVGRQRLIPLVLHFAMVHP
jgi:hypothetical protein